MQPNESYQILFFCVQEENEKIKKIVTFKFNFALNNTKRIEIERKTFSIGKFT